MTASTVQNSEQKSGQNSGEDQIKQNMDKMYRRTRHIYDITRKYYLLGRDNLIESIDANEGENICEVGCGTARNLIKIAQRYPKANFYGLDASDEMLKTAGHNLENAKMAQTITLKQAYSQSFQPDELFNIDKPLNKIVFSYALSIILPWQESIDHALELLPEGGEIHIVDFGGQDDLPKAFSKFIFWWLKMFHVFYKPEILDYLKRLEVEKKGTLDITHLYKGYTYRAVFKKI
ncbi:MAG: methyltransferase type 12 [Alphaproteobacteria bacterium]|nr:MAG: methyltransferase type 12 [Alphaproteobacteria bacterium]